LPQDIIRATNLKPRFQTPTITIISSLYARLNSLTDAAGKCSNVKHLVVDFEDAFVNRKVTQIELAASLVTCLGAGTQLMQSFATSLPIMTPSASVDWHDVMQSMNQQKQQQQTPQPQKYPSRWQMGK